MDPQEVLRRATLASQNLRSVAFEGQADIVGKGMDGTHLIFTNGILQDGGRQMACSVEVQGKNDRSVKADVVAEGSFYFRPLVVRGIPGSGEVRAMTGSWWKLSGGSGAVQAASVTPDPRLLRAQSEAVDIVRDAGEEMMGESRVHHYEVAVNPQKLLRFLQMRTTEQGGTPSSGNVEGELSKYEAKGQLWIDTKTYILHRLQWTIADRGSGQTSTFTFTFKDHDRASLIALPQDAIVLSDSQFRGTYHVLSSFFPFLPRSDDSATATGITLFIE
jgi:hypothetical protein